ncbi:MmgE/PrpD family protein [Microbacterium plantarum]|uniref:MmgE/PrpD family protein n=1 Tax=Microbacterium plantarum TaxID=1816425 RepID=A0ABV5ENP2_9MICO
MTTHREACRALGEWAVSAPFARASDDARRSLIRAVENLLAVTVGAAAMPEMRRLRRAWTPSPGPATLLGTPHRVAVEAAVWLNGVAGVSTERDEGNRYSKGHPAAQTVPAVLALAEAQDIAGERLWDALYVAYEVAARIGRAATFRPDVHTHGPLGAVGAAAACAVLLGADADGVARAVGAGAAMAPATSWQPVLRGSAVRDQWVGQGALAGLAAARFSAAGLAADPDGLAADLGGLGTIDPDAVIRGLGDESLVTTSYLKQHSACAYTHGPADAALLVRARMVAADVDLADIVSVRVEGVASAASLPAVSWSSRHGAYFSVPFAVASALWFGDVSAERADVPPHPQLARIAAVVSVTDATADLRPDTATSRPARVTVHLADGTAHTASVRHPQGDAVDTPFSEARVDELLTEALRPTGLRASDIHLAVHDFTDPDPGALTRALGRLAPPSEGDLA